MLFKLWKMLTVFLVQRRVNLCEHMVIYNHHRILILNLHFQFVIEMMQPFWVPHEQTPWCPNTNTIWLYNNSFSLCILWWFSGTLHVNFVAGKKGDKKSSKSVSHGKNKWKRLMYKPALWMMWGQMGVIRQTFTHRLKSSSFLAEKEQRRTSAGLSLKLQLHAFARRNEITPVCSKGFNPKCL